jgi:hypothetical protein
MLKRIKKTYKRRYTKRKQTHILERGNCFLSESEDKRRRKRLSYFILGLAILLVTVPSIFLLKTRIEQHIFVSSEQEILKEQKTVTMVMTFYRHQVAYVDYCKSLGVSLVAYPTAFNEYFLTQKSVLEDYLKTHRKLTLHQAFTRLKNKFSYALQRAVEADFDKMAIDLKQYVPEQTQLTHTNVCQALETNAQTIINSYNHADYLNIKDISNALVQ